MDEFFDSLNPGPNDAVLVSGGMDSRVLSTLLLMKAPVTTINIIKVTMDNYPHVDRQMMVHGDDSMVMMDRMALTIRSFADEYDKIWTAENSHPPGDWFANHPQTPPRPHKATQHPKHTTPLMGYDKSFTVALAQHFDIDISDTHSCVVDPHEHCRECWFCKEREWGYMTNGLSPAW